MHGAVALRLLAGDVTFLHVITTDNGPGVMSNEAPKVLVVARRDVPVHQLGIGCTLF